MKRYTLVGGLALIVDFAALYMLTEWAGLHYIFSATIAFVAGLSLNYALSTRWVFRNRRYGDKRLEFMIFLAVGVGGIALTDLIIAGLTPLLSGSYLTAKTIAVALIYFWNFFLRRQILFSKTTPTVNPKPPQAA